MPRFGVGFHQLLAQTPGSSPPRATLGPLLTTPHNIE